MRGRGIATACAIMSAGALVLQGCGRKMPADATEETNTEITMESVETTKAEESNTEESNTELHREQDSPTTELATPRVTGTLHVEGTRLVDDNGNPIQLRGLSTHGLAWFPDYINEECFRQFR